MVMTLRAWANLYGRKLNEEAIVQWLKIFSTVDSRVLAVAIEKVTKNAERMPTPGMLTKAIASVWDAGVPGVEMPLRFHYDPDCKVCGGTGWMLIPSGEGYKSAVPCDCRSVNEKEFIGKRLMPAVGFDPETLESVNIMVDKMSGKHLYRAMDCPEGREFLATTKLLGQRSNEGVGSDSETERPAKAHKAKRAAKRDGASKNGSGSKD